jgi:hypothetical protein
MPGNKVSSGSDAKPWAIRTRSGLLAEPVQRLAERDFEAPNHCDGFVPQLRKNSLKSACFQLKARVFRTPNSSTPTTTYAASLNPSGSTVNP